MSANNYSNDTKSYSRGVLIQRIIVIAVLVILSIISIFPFWITFVNTTITSQQIQSGITIIPGGEFMKNVKNLLARSDTINVLAGFKNSMIISVGFTALAVFFSTATAYGLTVYQFKGKDMLYAFILGIMMIPQQVSIIGFYQFMSKMGLLNSFVPLIVTAVAAPAVVFFMKQYMSSALSISLVEAARIDGCSEFRTFFQIALPLCKPAIATQAIFNFITSWNNFFTPSIILTDKTKYTLPVMVSMLKSDQFRTDYGLVYTGIFFTIIPLIVVYLILSKYIIAGVALGGVKE